MRIARLTARLIELELKREIKHASAARSASTNVLVGCELADGTVGWGEGVPRSYVTGETPEGAMRQMAATGLAEQLGASCENWSDVLEMCERFRLTPIDDDPRDQRGNAPRCAIEMSVLDAFARLFGDPLSRVTELYAPAKSVLEHQAKVRYSGAVTAASPRKEAISCLKMRVFGFRDCKIKVGVVPDEYGRLRRIRRWIGRGMRLRLDANEAWRPEAVVDQIRRLEPLDVASVEQPIPHAEVAALAEARRQIDTPLMLDESLTSMFDAEAAVRDETCDLFNLRLSKCGGYLSCLRLAAMARRHGLGYQLGCHPGESGVLSAAGRHWASSVADIRFLEGSYDRHLLRRLLTVEDITFGYGGVAPALTRPGLGVNVDRVALERVCRRSECFELQ